MTISWFFRADFPGKKGWAKARISAVRSNRRVTNSNHFFMDLLFLDSATTFFKIFTFVNRVFLNLRSWKRWMKIGIRRSKRAQRSSGCLNSIPNFNFSNIRKEFRGSLKFIVHLSDEYSFNYPNCKLSTKRKSPLPFFVPLTIKSLL